MPIIALILHMQYQRTDPYWLYKPSPRELLRARKVPKSRQRYTVRLEVFRGRMGRDLFPRRITD